MEATWNPPPNETIWWLVGLFKKTKKQISESGAIQVEADSKVQELANTFPEALQRRHPDKGILNGVGEHHWVCYCCMHQLSKSQFKAQVAHGGIWCSAQGAFDDRVDTLSAS